MEPRIKICVVGSGSAAAAFILQALCFCKDGAPFIIDCIHNPKISILTVGESCSYIITKNIRTSLLSGANINSIIDEFDGRTRLGTVQTWENDLGHKFITNYMPNENKAMHINSEKFSKFVLKKANELYEGIFTEQHKNVLDIQQNGKCATVVCEDGNLEYDYVVDCRGTPTTEEFNNDDYAYTDFETVNSVMIYPEFKSYDEHYTSAKFHKNGWMFGIPLRHRKAFGYLYNNQITSKDEALNHFKLLKPELEEEKLRYFNWKQYYRKKAMDGRILYMGNKLYFFEPIMGLPLHYYTLVSQGFLNHLYDYFKSSCDIENFVNSLHTADISKIQDVVAFNYVGENNMKSKFWLETKQNGIKRLRNSIRFKEWADCVIENDFVKPYFPHNYEIIIQYLDGYKIDLNKVMGYK